jgi:hypothetical protein
MSTYKTIIFLSFIVPLATPQSLRAGENLGPPGGGPIEGNLAPQTDIDSDEGNTGTTVSHTEKAEDTSPILAETTGENGELEPSTLSAPKEPKEAATQLPTENQGVATGPRKQPATLAPPPSDDVMPTVEEKEKTPPKPGTIALWSLVGFTGVAVISGAVFGVTAIEEKRRYDDNSIKAFEDRWKGKQLASEITFGVAVATAIATIIVWRKNKKRSESPPMPPKENQISFALGLSGGSLSVAF